MMKIRLPTYYSDQSTCDIFTLEPSNQFLPQRLGEDRWGLSIIFINPPLNLPPIFEGRVIYKSFPVVIHD